MAVISLRWFGPLSRFAEWVHQAALAPEKRTSSAATGVERMSELLRAPCSDLRSKSAKEQLDSFI
jgi:hypothetical protein